MRRLLALAPVALLSLAGCDEAPPPPGEVIGTFAFTPDVPATAAGEGRCDLPGSPTSLRFDAVLSYEPSAGEDGSRRFWIQILGRPGDPLEGRLVGTRFVVRSPPEPDRVPRSLAACRLDDDGDGVPDRTRCTLQFAEYIAGDLLARIPPGNCTAEALAACETCAREGTCASCALDGLPEDFDNVGGVCSEVTEDVVPAPADEACLCTGALGTVSPASPCTIVYRLVGRLS